MPSKKQENNQIDNPISGAMAFGLGGAAVTAIGAAIRGNSVHNEAMTVLVGGVVTGAMAGTFGCCLPNTKDANCGFKIAFGVLNTGLKLGAFLAAPAMGEQLMNLGTKWAPTVVDGLIGKGVILGGIAAIGVVACCSVGGKVASDAIRSTLWGSSRNTTNNTSVQYTHPVAIATVTTDDVTVVMNKV